MLSHDLVQHIHHRCIPFRLIHGLAVIRRQRQTYTATGSGDRELFFANQILDCFTLSGWRKNLFVISPFSPSTQGRESATILA
jgi:hypothetical protein